MRKHHKNQKGITLLITLLLMGVFLGISTSLLNITLKQFQLSGITASSEIAFQAANAGMECILYHDQPQAPGVSPFVVMGNGTTVAEETNISCMDDTSEDIEDSDNDTVVSGEEQRFQFNWGNNPEVCSDVSLYKFHNTNATATMIVNGINYRPTPAGNGCPPGGFCTVVQARGYNVECSEINNGNRVVEREYTAIY